VGGAVSDGHLAWTYPGVAVSGMFMGCDTQTRLAYVKTRAGLVNFSQPANLRGQLTRVAPGTTITITFRGLQNGQKMFRVSPHDVDVWPSQGS
jgi:hypothetical protein